MAIKWAVANGNWNAGATWNDGSVPMADDEVYFNGFQITLNNFNLSVKKISNAICPGTGNQGGKLYFSGSSNIVLSAETFEQYAAETLMDIRQATSGNRLTISATKVINQNGYFLYISPTWNILLSLNVGTFEIGSVAPIYYTYYHVGNTISITNSQIIYSGVNRELIGTVSLNNIANITIISAADNFFLGINFNAATFTFNGIKVTLLRNFAATTSNISGIVNANGHLLVSTTINISGGIEYQGSNIGVRYTILNIQNPDTFTWKDISEPRSNPFIIVTNADMNNRQQYPTEDEVKQGTEYIWGQKVGTYTPDYPPESVVLQGYEYGDSDDRKTGTMEQEVNVEVGCVTPEDVRKDVPLVGMGVDGSLVVPSVDDVREGVVFDNGSVGTLIVQGGGDRLRIADFGYYTNAQSDTYIVDLTEQDKPKFAVAEERVLIEMFPELDLDNIPEKYFDDLFVKYLKYRLIVEYYRTAGINSTFTPSEPTTEIVNYQNVRNEVWLNSANIYLKSWARKYPNSITKPHRTLL